ncbi:TPA: NAD(P)H-hydrate epimerase [Candidatus Woesearchaeota archaeon]|nr:NAD(P)H-hydrate epimerase [Candidatus Woesearchaeota archaeon]HII66323.1 NAD(P)H-hydrate epimerase [Candidatus Woesearchaeota archaeon]
MMTAQQMKELEAASGIPSLILMENAGKAFVEELKRHHETKGKKILVACYHGRNGGDGFAIANQLADGSEVDVLFIGDEEKLVRESAHFFHHVNNNPLIQFVAIGTVDFDEYDLIIDAILGIGIHHYLKPEIAVAVRHINEAKAIKVSADIPTGLDPDTGKMIEQAINADLIITFHDMKPGLEQFGDKVRVVGIGLPFAR